MLKVGEANTICMSILNKYRIDGVGLHSFTDKQDGQQYIYTQFEADFCHYVFPCFDQPDLKAVWTLSALTEDDWTVIANESEQTCEERTAALKSAVESAAQAFDTTYLTLSKPKATHILPSARISPYIYAIVAGPYDYFERQSEGLPLMRIYARKSLMESVNHKLMFDITESGMHFYKSFFGKAYPFGKYD